VRAIAVHAIIALTPHRWPRTNPEVSSSSALSFDALVYTATLAHCAMMAWRYDDGTEITMELSYTVATLRLDSFNHYSAPPGTAFVIG